MNPETSSHSQDGGALPQRSQLAQLARRSVARLRDAVRSGALTTLAAVDPLTGEMVDAEARALFSGLPAISPNTSVDELISHGLLDAAPENLAMVTETPKYRLGRQVFVRGPVVFESESPRRPVGHFLPEGSDAALLQVSEAFTHRGVLRGQKDGQFLVQVADQQRLYPRQDIFAWNEPIGVPASGGTISGIYVDYNDPRLKAYICAGYIEHGAQIKALDFGAAPDELLENQGRIVRKLAQMVDMGYPGVREGYGGSRAGALIAGGVGVDFVQRAVAGGFLQAFSRSLGFEVQIAVGRSLRLGVPRGFLVLTLLPSMKRYVCDPAWSEPLTDLSVAFFGPRWGHDRRLESFEGHQDVAVRESDISVPELSS